MVCCVNISIDVVDGVCVVTVVAADVVVYAAGVVGVCSVVDVDVGVGYIRYSDVVSEYVVCVARYVVGCGGDGNVVVTCVGEIVVW